ncbi:HEAT repeat domain-containing protein [bacterium]|uniref:PBS lyase HEAT domain protein repeat-containing protein n=1 Tax=Rubinisphaera brasiliensis (strain ATCC 49424 / DSM 5305 / JCM 21570 / IAM 15109 / NBRC 103401 / IFAM 1448) TaxID=756272 RepID=F0SNW2_RUBBR|nr:HEAT repeat domain-containing protein [Rubinisphaera brasiliensis]ADY60038.1 hypothetical protein Plabr_2437 [Rubinisphaera brasiliensis DSM 5305]MBR9803234.1 HEAT repeat domain-containing protein [bacterium]
MSENSTVEKTIRVLEQSKSPAAQAVLMHALTVNDPQIRDMAARALVRSGSALGKTEVIRHIDVLSPDVVEELSEDEKAMSFPLRQCMEHGDHESSRKALETIESAHLYGEIPFLVKLIATASGERADQCEQVLLALIDKLYEQRSKQKASEPTSINQHCEELLQLFGLELSQFEKLKRPRALIESVLILSDPEDGVARQLIRESSTDCQGMVWDILLESRHDGVLMFLIKSLNIKYVHPRILEIVARRRDIEFQLALVRSIPERLSVNQERNFCQLQGLPWLFPGERLWQSIPDQWQGRVIRLVDALAFRHDQRVGFYESALEHAGVQGKVAAAQHRTMIRPQLFEQFVLEALESEDPAIEGWAVSELRNTELPDKYRFLVNRLDSGCPEVQRQAREALGRFDVPTAILFCETARPSVGPKLAELLLKINPDASQDLARELANPVRTRRLRAAKAAAFMGMEGNVTEALIEMLFDSDSIVRRAVAEILGSVPTPAVVGALETLLEDSSPRVREAAEASLQQILATDEGQAASEAAKAQAKLEMANQPEGDLL